MPTLRERLRGGAESPTSTRDEVRRLWEQFKPELMREVRRSLLEVIGEEGAVQIKGDRGYSPQKGVDYNDGAEGPQGPMGPQGPRGPKGEKGDMPSISKVADLVLKRLEGKKTKLDEVEGLNELLRALDRKAGGGGGGGMGNVTHQHESISSATTTVSTTSPIAGNGYALWCYYQGQFLARGTDYTVGSDRKTLTLSFTPQDSTVLDIVYIRG